MLSNREKPICTAIIMIILLRPGLLPLIIKPKIAPVSPIVKKTISSVVCVEKKTIYTPYKIVHSKVIIPKA